MKRKITSVFLALVLVLSLLPTAAFAAEPGQEPEPPQQGTETPQNPPLLEEEGDDLEKKDDVPEGNTPQGSVGALNEGYPSFASEDEEEETEEETGLNTTTGVEEEAGADEPSATIEFITSGPDISSNGPRRAQSRAARQTYEYDKQYFGQQLTDGTAVKALYNTLVTEYVSNGSPQAGSLTVHVSGNLTEQGILDALAAFDRDYPEVFWLKPSSYNTNMNSVTFEVSSPWTTEGLSAAINTVTSQVNTLADEAQKASSEPLLQLKYVHDWLVNNNTYNTTAAGQGSAVAGDAPWEAISALDENLSPVCEGYSRAFKLVCEKLGIPCILVSGQGTNSAGKSEAHMWNYVQLDGEWYLMDVTWDDPSNVEMLSFDHFLIGSTTDNNRHVNNSQFISTGPDDNKTYNKDFSYPGLNGDDYDYLAKLGIASVSVEVTPAEDGTADTTGGSINYYKVPAGGSREITLTAKFLDASGNPVTLPNDLCAVSWTQIDGFTLTDNKDNTAKLTRSADGLETNHYAGAPLTITFIRTKWEDVSTVYFTLGEAAPVGTVSITCKDHTPGEDGKYAVEIPSNDETSSVLEFSATDSSDASATFTWSISPRENINQFGTSGSFVFLKNAAPGEYTVTATSSTGASASVKVIAKRAASVPTTVTLDRSAGILHIPEAGHVNETANTETWGFKVLDQYGEQITGDALNDIQLQCTLPDTIKDSISVTQEIMPMNPTLGIGQDSLIGLSLRMTKTVEQNGNYAATVKWSTDGTTWNDVTNGTFTVQTQKFDVTRWPEASEILAFHNSSGQSVSLQAAYPTSLYDILYYSNGIGKINPYFNNQMLQSGYWGVYGYLSMKDLEGSQTTYPKPGDPIKCILVFTSTSGYYVREKEYDFTGLFTITKGTVTLSLTGDTTVSAGDLNTNKDTLKNLPNLPTTVSVKYTNADPADAPTTLNITGWTSKGNSVDTALATLNGANPPEKTTAVLVPAVDTSTIDSLATVSAVPEYEITVTGREVATITTGTDLLSKIYDGAEAEAPTAFSVVDKENQALPTNGDNVKIEVHFEKDNKTIPAPKDVGAYKLVVTYSSDSHYGSQSFDFTISPRTLELEWPSLTELSYTGNSYKMVPKLKNVVAGDEVSINANNGEGTNAGTYNVEVTTTLDGKDKGNYALPNDGLTKTYTIKKLARTVTPTSLILLPNSLSGTLTVAGLVEADKNDAEAKALTIAFKSGADNTIVSLNSSTGAVTALKNGKTTLVVSADATTNYEAINAEVEVTAVVTPVTGATVKGDTGDQLVAALDGTTVKVTGLAANPDAITVTLTLADDLGLSQAANGSVITVKLGEATVGTYTVDTTGVKKVPTGVTIQAGKNPTPETSDTISDENKEAAAKAAEDLKPEAPDLTGAASDQLVKAGQEAAPAGSGKNIIVETTLVVTVKDYVPSGKERTLKLEITPKYTIKDQDNGTIIKTEEIAKLTAPIKISIKLPDYSKIFSNMEHVFARHHKKDGSTEILKTSWDQSGTILSWFQQSFSDVSFEEDARSTKITFNKADGTSQTVDYALDMVSRPLPDSGHKDGWKYGDKTYTVFTDDLLTLLDGKAVTFEPATSTPVTPGKPTTPTTPTTPSTPSGGGSSSSSGSSTPGTVYTSSSSSGGSYSVSSKKPSNGTVSLSSTNAKPGATVTISPKPSQGYQLDTLTVLDKDGKRVSIQEKDGKYTFTMPKGSVTVEATFRPAGESETVAERSFGDVPAGYWADSAIRWASQNGYMNGTSATTFNPDGTITRQQMWMILARLNGQNPADFAGARAWAVESGVSDGSNGGSAMSRQQMVTFLYRYGQLMGYALTGSADLSGFPDSAGVSGYAQEPLSWATANGIVAGTTQGTLNPGGTATRAQFAVILQRFYQNVVEA